MRFSVLFGVGLVGVLLGGVLIYSPGMSAVPGFDDAVNLRLLSEVSDWRSAREFVLSGVGVLGRPLALATFLPYAGDWVSLYSDMLRDNLLLHLLNICLVVWCALRLLRLAEPDLADSQRAPIALLSGALWGFSPLLMSTSLLAIQRMTSLSVLFMLIGLLLYLIGRARLVQRGGYAGALIMSLGVLGGGALAFLCKEIGALLPALLLVAEITLLSSVRNGGAWFRWWKRVFLWLPSSLIVMYLLSTLPGAVEAYAHRDFTLTQRLLSQPVILFDYLLNALLPRRMVLSPFHDDYSLPGMSIALLAIAGWVALGWAVWKLRRFSAWPSFAYCWYLVAHLLESSVIPLELYFEHRNYLPLIGIWIAFAAMLVSVPARFRRVVPVLVVVYMALLMSVSHAHGTVWGDPALAARMWAAAGPSSDRALQFLSRQMLEEGDHVGAWKVLDEAGAREGGSDTLLLQSIHVGCGVDDSDHRRARFDLLMSRAPGASLSFAMHDGIRKLSASIAEEGEVCKGVAHEDLMLLIAALRENPKYVANSNLIKFLLKAEAQVFVDMGDFDEAFRVVRDVYEIQPSTDIAIDIALQYLIRDDHPSAASYLERERKRLDSLLLVGQDEFLKLEAVSSLLLESED